jgi:hypothetical protein
VTRWPNEMLAAEHRRDLKRAAAATTRIDPVRPQRVAQRRRLRVLRSLLRRLRRPRGDQARVGAAARTSSR